MEQPIIFDNINTKVVDELRRQKRRKRNELEDREDEISAQRKCLLAELEKRMIQTTSSNDIFFIAWNTL